MSMNVPHVHYVYNNMYFSYFAHEKIAGVLHDTASSFMVIPSLATSMAGRITFVFTFMSDCTTVPYRVCT